MQRGRHKRMKSRCVWAVEENEEGKRLEREKFKERNNQTEECGNV